jgi:NADPH:quinone reductase-like Zn-dependent oxidoreductase
VKAIVQERFGSPDVLRFADVDEPTVGTDDVLIEVRAASVNPYDWHMLRGDPYVARLIGGVGFTRPTHRVAGADAAGVVTAVGADVAGIRPGDEVMGWFDGAFAEYARTPAARVVPMPAGLTFEDAASLPMAGETALRAIRDVGRVASGQRVLVNGAAGGVGSLAVQIAAALGAEVTGVCGSRNVELVASLGAAHVVDHTREDLTRGQTRYDVILDNVGSQPLARLRRELAPTGTLVANAGGRPGRVLGPIGSILRIAVVDLFVRQRLLPLPSTWTRQDLLDVTALVDTGRLRPVVGRTFPLADAAAAIAHVEAGHARGKTVLSVA